MVKNGEFFVIKEMRQRGMYTTHIARELGRDPKTIRKILEQAEPGTSQSTVISPQKMEPFKEYVRKRMEEGCTNAMVLYDEIKAQCYSGSVTTLRYFMRPLRPIVASKATERFETEPGEQAQVDWGHFRVDWNHTKIHLYAFVMVLGYWLFADDGVGKIHLAVALALEAITKRYSVYFITAHDLVQTLQQAFKTNTMQQKIRTLLKADLLIIDEIGYRKMEEEAAHFFFQIISERYEKGSIILTSKKSFGSWGEIFGDTVLATAILDQLLHHSVTINIKGESYRIKEKKKASLFKPDQAAEER